MCRLLASFLLLLLFGVALAGGLPARSEARPDPPPTPHILKIGVRQLPVNLSPALASTDHELRAVDLLFEGLMRLVPGPDGSSVYRPALAIAPPELVPPLGRTFQLPEDARWSDDKAAISAKDVRDSYLFLRDGNLGRSPAYAYHLEDPKPTEDYRLTLKLTRGALEPQAFLTFKIVPTHAGSPASKEFAANPVGSGRFRVKEFQKPEDKPRNAVVLEANPSYAKPPRQGSSAHRSTRSISSRQTIPSPPSRRERSTWPSI